MKEEDYEYNPAARMMKMLEEYRKNALIEAQIALNQRNDFRQGFNDGCVFAYERAMGELEIVMRYYDITPKHIEE